MKSKRLLTYLLIFVLIVTACVFFVACEIESEESFKVGLICLNDTFSAYDNNFISAFTSVCAELGVETFIKTNVKADNCYSVVKGLVDNGCSVIFANSFEHESEIIKCARSFPNVEFCQATGVRAEVESLRNYHNAFASIYQGRYLTGIAAGLKLNEMITNGEIDENDARLGYVGAYNYAEVISGYTAFYLGAKSVCPSVTMDVVFTNSWYDEVEENACANTLISSGALVISQHADSMIIPTVCETYGVYNVSYNDSTLATCPNTYLVSCKVNWDPYYRYVITQKLEGKAIATDWCGSLKEGSVVLSNGNASVLANNTLDMIAKAKEDLQEGTLDVFSVDNFTVSGEPVSSYLVDLDCDGVRETEVISGGTFEESKFRSAPYFDLKIDGINILEE